MIRFEGHDGQSVWVTPEDVRGIKRSYKDGYSFLVYNAANNTGDTVKGDIDEVAKRIMDARASK